MVKLRFSALAGLSLLTAVPMHASAPIPRQKISADNGAAGDFFGFSVAMSNGTAIVGAFRADDKVKGTDVGAAYIFVRSKNTWHQQAILSAGDGVANDSLGGNVALSGDTAVAGAIGHDEKGDNAGAAYVFGRSGNVWTHEVKLTAADGYEGDAFGQSIAIDGDTMVIGAPHDDDNGDGSGSAYVFLRKGGIWKQQAKLVSSDGAAGDLFGISVALDHDTIVIGADLNDEIAQDAGAAYVFVRLADGWVQQAKLTALDGADTDIFGVRVALSGDTALISARRDDDSTIGVDAGSAYVFSRSGAVWQQEAKLTSPDPGADDRFGRDVALVGDTALISAMHEDDHGENSGAAHVYVRSGSSWKHQIKLTAADGASGDLFGWSVAMSDGDALVAASRNDNTGENSGSAYVFAIDES